MIEPDAPIRRELAAKDEQLDCGRRRVKVGGKSSPEWQQTISRSVSIGTGRHVLMFKSQRAGGPKSGLVDPLNRNRADLKPSVARTPLFANNVFCSCCVIARLASDRKRL